MRTTADKIDFAIRMQRPTHIELLFDHALRQVVRGRTEIRPQFVLYGYIADFYLPGLGLVLEVDGPLHDTPKQRSYDRYRDARLISRGLTVKRFSYRDLQCPMMGIQHKIRTILNSAKNKSH